MPSASETPFSKASMLPEVSMIRVRVYRITCSGLSFVIEYRTERDRLAACEQVPTGASPHCANRNVMRFRFDPSIRSDPVTTDLTLSSEQEQALGRTAVTGDRS